MMTRTLVGTCLAVLLGLATTGRLEASWNYPGSSSYYYSSYDYCPAPVLRYYYCAPARLQVAPPCALPPVQLPKYANPTPAPPSAIKAPPNGKAGSGLPRVMESRTTILNEGATLKSAEPSSTDVCKVGFWNVSPADVKVIVNGLTHVIARNRNLTLTLSREFTYQIDAQAPQTERVPNDKTVHEIVIR